ncbi:50S ribosomal protein L21 [Bartonella sp. B41]
MFAVIKTGGKQYRVFADQLVKVEKVIGNVGDVVEFSDVLMIGEESNVAIGVPIVANALVTAEIVEQGRARKVVAFKKRRRQNSKRTRGHRQEITVLRILDILTGDEKQKKVVVEAVGKGEAVSKETAKRVKSAASVKKNATKAAEKEAVSQKVATTSSDDNKD